MTDWYAAALESVDTVSVPAPCVGCGWHTYAILTTLGGQIPVHAGCAALIAARAEP